MFWAVVEELLGPSWPALLSISMQAALCSGVQWSRATGAGVSTRKPPLPGLFLPTVPLHRIRSQGHSYFQSTFKTRLSRQVNTPKTALRYLRTSRTTTYRNSLSKLYLNDPMLPINPHGGSLSISQAMTSHKLQERPEPKSRTPSQSPPTCNYT